MRRILIFTGLAVACALAASAAGWARSTVGAPPCQEKTTKANGSTATVKCGPATATLKYKGKTYTFKNGYCATSKLTHGFFLDLGTFVVNSLSEPVKGNDGKSYFGLTVQMNGNKLGTALISYADMGGKQILPETIVTLRGGVAKGTFSQHGTMPVSGSWNCHGVIYNGP